MVNQSKGILSSRTFLLRFSFLIFFYALTSTALGVIEKRGILAHLLTDQSGENKDALEGETVRLACRFNPQLLSRTSNELVFYWQRSNKEKKDVVAFKETILEKEYSIEFSPHEGKYDLLISQAQYDRDNGDFECKFKESGNGAEVKSVSYLVTILIPPGPPRITPLNPVAKEGETFALTCSSQGGSPDPTIQWYRDNVLLQGQIHKGGTRDQPTSNVLTINPSKEDDRAIYKCAVWNRATREEQKLEATISLTVHYKPRIKVGPFNPLNVLVNGDAYMTCEVDANPPVKNIKWLKSGSILSTSNNHTIVRVTADDSGLYTCMADNGVGGRNGEPGKAELELSVLYGPKVNVIQEREATLGDALSVKCNVASNPKPHTVIWKKEGDENFWQNGDVLKLNPITADDTGRYWCTASNALKPSGAISTIEKSSNASVFIRVQHKPGDTEIVPLNPIAVAGKPFSLSCMARPPGWPLPQYRWWREGHEQQELSRSINYTFISVHVSQEGRYFCQPFNALGKGSIGSVYLTVNEAPSMVIPMQPHFTRKEGDKGFSLTCRARGKPKPSVSWWQNGQEISIDNGLFRVETRETVEDVNVWVLQSTLHFDGLSRKGTNSLTASDRGRFVCVFDNGLGSGAKSESMLRIEHSPVVRHTYNRVAFDLGETATLQCKMSAYPQPKFEWSFQGKGLDSDGVHYRTNVSDLGDDVYAGLLSIRDISSEDYGDYLCRSWNNVGDDDEKTIIKLVKKSAPDTPMQLEFIEVLSDSVTLRWMEGFNGGFSNTEFIVTYSPDNSDRWRNESCRSINPCKITGLESRKEYRFKVLAVNPRGYSQYSDIIKAATKVNLKDMPNAYESSYDRERNTLFFRVEPNALKLVAKIEVRDGNEADWFQLTTVPIISDYEEVYLKPTPQGISDVRIILCLQSNDSWCGYEHLVKMDSSSTYLRETNRLSTEYLVMVVVIGASIALVIAITLVCSCRKRKNANKKDYEMESNGSHPKVTTISPPYYAGHDNKGLVSNDTNGAHKTSPPPMYTNGPSNGHIPQNYYLTGEGGDPSPSGSNDTAHSDLWMMKSDMLPDGGNETAMSYHSAYGSTQMQMDQNYPPALYSYYHEDYQPLADETMSMNMRNAIHSPYYDDGTNAYGTAMGMGMMGDTTTDPHMLSAMDPNKVAHMVYDEELEYGGNRSGRVIREIIV